MTEQRNSSMRPALRVVLIVSLALNLLVVGVVAGGIFRGRPPAPLGGVDLGSSPFARALNADDQRHVRDTLRGQMHNIVPAAADRRLALQELVAALRQDPFDPAAVQAMFDQQKLGAMAAMEASQAAVLDRIQAMDAAGRAAFADRLENEMRHPPHR